MDNHNAAAPLIAVPDAPGLVARRVVYPESFHVPPHRHARAQFLFAVRGTMAVRATRCAWIVPTSRALWIPAGAVHEIEMHGEVEMRTVYVDPDAAAPLWQHCVVLEVTPLLRELMIRVCDQTPGTSVAVTTGALARLLTEEIATSTPCALDLPLPESADLVSICRNAMADLAQRRPVGVDAARIAQSARTVHRRFARETGISFARWKQQARVLEAIRRLSLGVPVTTVALDMGYDSPGAFATMFRRALGMPPRDFVKALRGRVPS